MTADRKSGQIGQLNGKSWRAFVGCPYWSLGVRLETSNRRDAMV